jgi:stalled ribosome alternative rescue factor ArfA
MKPYDQHTAKRTQIRQDQKEAGFFDGRFVERTEKSKKAYSRKKKHKKDLDY